MSDTIATGNLLPHNIAVYDRLEAMIAENGKAIVVTATGTGKSYITMEFLERHNYNALVVCPKRAICNDWIKRSEKITAITYQSFSRLKEVEPFDCYVFDEAHHCGSAKWGKAVLELMESTTAPVIGLTADSHRYSDGGRDVAVEVWDNCVVYGYDQAVAVENGILPAATYVCTLFEASTLADEYKNKNISPSLLARLNYSIQNCGKMSDILLRHMPNGKRKGIVFVDSIEYTKEAEALIESTFPYSNILTVHSKMPQKQVEANLEAFRLLDEGYLISIDMLNEGLHIQGVNTIIMLRKTASPTVFTQQIGRGLSPENQSVVIFDFVGNRCSMKIIAERIGEVQRFETRKNDPKRANQIIVHDYASEILAVIRNIKRELFCDAWTDEEVEILKKYYPVEGRKVLQRLPNRSLSAILNCVYKLQIKGPLDKWTEDEDMVIKEKYPELGTAIAEYLPSRTHEAIRRRAKLLGVKYNSRAWSDEENAILIKYYPAEGIRVARRLPDRTKEAIRTQATKTLGLNKDNNKDWSQEELSLLNRYPNLSILSIKKLLPHRSLEAISQKLKDLNLFRSSSWTKDENEIMQKYYTVEGENILSRLPGRTWNAVISRAMFLNLHLRNPRWDQNEDDILKAHFDKPNAKKYYQKNYQIETGKDAYREPPNLGCEAN